MEFLRFKICKG